MNAKRIKYTTATLTTGVKEEVVPVLIHDPNNANGEPQYAYATFATADEAEAAVASLSGARRAAHEVIIDEHGRAMTLQELVQDENTTVEEVEAVEEADGTHTILHIQGEPLSPNSQQSLEGDCEDTSFESATGPGDTTRQNNKTFYCPNCGNCYSAAGSLKLHMRACLREKVEVPAELRKCEICQKVFNSVTYLREHMLRHTGEGPRKCQRCYRKFVTEEKLQAHMETHTLQDKLDAEAAALAAATGSKKVTVKEFTCSFCSKQFTVVFESGQVKRRYACDECREKFSNQELLKQHKQEIEDKREFHCERCGRKFVFEGFLQRHLPTCDGTIKRRRDMKLNERRGGRNSEVATPSPKTTMSLFTCSYCLKTFSGLMEANDADEVGRRYACQECHDNFSKQQPQEEVTVKRELHYVFLNQN